MTRSPTWNSLRRAGRLYTRCCAPWASSICSFTMGSTLLIRVCMVLTYSITDLNGEERTQYAGEPETVISVSSGSGSPQTSVCCQFLWSFPSAHHWLASPHGVLVALSSGRKVSYRWKSAGSYRIILNAQMMTCLQQVFINTLRKRQWVWIGLSDGETEGVWKWVDGSELITGFWYPGEPNSNGDEDCGLYGYGSDPVNNWADYPCNNQFFWMCEKRI
uniref:C-type lectin domain-containing protein n=1 Tax=Astyanax mexicanus TaxID=7994 RepID=A0A3B1K6W4_ASTMX